MREELKMYGWRKRIGLLVPSQNTTMEPEFYKMVLEGITIHTSRMFLRDHFSSNALIEMEGETERATKELSTAGVDIVIFGCTSGSFVKGFKYNIAIEDKIKGILGKGKEAITTSTAVIDALKALKAKKIAVATPYPEEINQKEKLFLEEAGFVVTNIKGLGFSERKQVYPLTSSLVSMVGLQEPYVAYKLAVDVNTDDSDCIFISCTNLRTIEIIQKLEKDLRKPVISSNQATLAMALRKVGIRERIEGYGTLLENI